MKRDKKGISPVIATILLILITVAAVTIIWAAIIPMITNKSAQATTCFDAQQQFTINTAEGYTCKNASGIVNVQVKRGANSGAVTITKLNFQIYDNVGSSEVNDTVADTESEMVSVNGAKVYNIDPTTTSPMKVGVAPIVKIGNSEQPCEVSQTVDLKACA